MLGFIKENSYQLLNVSLGHGRENGALGTWSGIQGEGNFLVIWSYASYDNS